jgi:hypothetical protein
MTEEIHPPAERLGVSAIGVSGRWEITVNESLDTDRWFLEVEGPGTYLVFQLDDQDVLGKALEFLQSTPSGQETGRTEEHGLLLGRFGSAPVLLLWDNEDFSRCFLLIGPEAGAALRLTVEGEDLQMFRDALQQVVNELHDTTGDAKKG